MVSQIGEAIYLLDLNIAQWNLQLARAQPLIPGRLQILFIKKRKVLNQGSVDYDRDPRVGKMVLMKSGAWRFVMLTPRDVYTKLSDLRVGRSMKGDAVVVRLIDGIEDMLAQRQILVDLLLNLRIGVPGKIKGILAACNRRSTEVVSIAARIKLDWHSDAVGSRLAIKTANSKNYQAKKARALRAKALATST